MRARAHRYIFEGKLQFPPRTFFTVKRFSFESKEKKKLLSSAGFNNERHRNNSSVSSLSPRVLDREYNYVLRLVNSIFFSLCDKNK